MDESGLSRRHLLQTGAAAFGGAGLGWSVGTLVESEQQLVSPGATAADRTFGAETIAFAGLHQAGVTTSPTTHLSLLGLDLDAGVHRAGLARLMLLWSDDARRLTTGQPALADEDIELAELPARLTVTFGFGPRVVSDLLPAGHGLALAPLPPFRTDRLTNEWGQTDLVVQVCSDDPVALAHGRRVLLKDGRGFAKLRWTQDGFRRSRRAEPDGSTTRNLMGQVDGTVNPSASEANDLVWLSPDDSVRGAGGTFLAVRRIRMHLDKWDRVSRAGKEFTIGRRLDNGAPLTGAEEHDEPDLNATDEHGFPVIDPASHIHRARSKNHAERFLRRAYNYVVPDPGLPAGEDSGLIFLAFARDLTAQFVPIQARLAEQDLLNQWTSAVGSAVYLIPPGVGQTTADAGDFVGSRLLTRA